MSQLYADEPVVALGLDLWNGSEAQVELFAELAGITYPLLMDAGAAGLGDAYDCIQTSFFVVDGHGMIVYRNAYAPADWPNWHPDEVAAAIDAALADLVEVAAPPPAPAVPILEPPFPNPANPSVSIVLSLPWAGPVDVTVMDARGRRVRQLHSGRLSAGEHEWTWDGRDDAGRTAPSGTYVVWSRANGIVARRGISLVR